MEHMNYEILAKALLQEDAARVESLLDTMYRGGGRCDRVLDEACRYSLMAGGKRVRPALPWNSAVCSAASPPMHCPLRRRWK